MVLAFFLTLSACGGAAKSVVNSSAVAPAPSTSLASSSTSASTVLVAAITITSAATTTITTVTAVTTTASAPLGRDTRLALVECGRQAGSLTLGLAVGDGDIDTLKAARSSCQKASDLLDVDGRGVRGPTPINKMSVLVAQRAAMMAEAAVGIAVKGKASDELLNTAGKWSDDFTAAMKLLP